MSQEASGGIEQGKFHASPFEQSGQYPAFISTEREVFGLDVSVASFELLYQPAFGAVFATEQRSRTDIVGKDGKQKGILSVLLEHHQTLHQVCPKQGIRLPFRHRRSKVFSLLQLMTISDIGSILEPM